MTNPNDRRPNVPPRPPTAAPSSDANQRGPRSKTNTEAATGPATSAPDPLKTQMPTGEIGVRNAPGEVLAGESGGTSKAEDTPRAAGYVADQTRTNEPPPGPPVAKSPENFAGPESTTIPPVPRKPTGSSVPPPPPTPDPSGTDPKRRTR